MVKEILKIFKDLLFINDYIYLIYIRYKFKVIAKLYEIEKFEGMIRKAKMHHDLQQLEQIHTAILETLRYLQDFKQHNKRAETHPLNDDIHRLQDLNCLIFQIFAELQESLHFKLRDKNKQFK